MGKGIHGHTKDGGRWCDGCDRWHGEGYICHHYSEELAAEIDHQNARFRRLVHDPEWIKAQIANGCDPLAIGIAQAFEGDPT